MQVKDKIQLLIPFTPLIAVFIVLILRPYFLFPVGGDTDFHLARAQEILQNPFWGLFWDNITYYPMGRPVWHQPLFNAVYAGLWYLAGVRFAHSFLCVFQVLLTVGVASWFANREYGIFAGYFAGLFALAMPAPSTLTAAIPAAYIPILAVLTIYYIPHDKKKACIASLVGLWTHMVALFCFIPLYLVDNYRDKTNLKIIALLLPSWLFWAGYWVYFKDRLVTGGIFYTLTHLKLVPPHPGSYAFLIFLAVFVLGIIGLYLLYNSNYRQFKLFTTYIVIVIFFSFFGFNGDFLRGFQFAALPMAILAGFAVERGYKNLSSNRSRLLSSLFLLFMVFISMIGVVIFFSYLPNQHGKGWDALETPFEGEYAPLKDYIENSTSANQVVWTERELSEKVAWMTGRSVSNGLYPDNTYGGTRGFVDQHQNINIYKSDGYVTVRDLNNNTIVQIKLGTY
ncbi:hypothetical protein [Methanobacterium sp. BAmetb5]|uniref:hypothetical protein n=1 Tax=Methanobacterium sp. BAmetb5 TaxID=2025351 RepID=UPI000E90955E|nr:hypothetical protein [Methanobacterium sp. BAmetb5]AXV40959.1 MAG: hypothetical protein CIT02_11850 [Methanobacterium sp. BAmetb5]